MTLVVVLTVSACGGGGGSPIVPTPRPLPVPTSPSPDVARGITRVSLPARVNSTRWRVSAQTTVRVSGSRDEQQVESRALVSWALDRRPSGALRATGQVDSFSVRMTPASGAMLPTPPALLLVDGVVDSVTARVVTRPLLTNECDRPEAGAAALARELLVRVPDGVVQGDQWRDSTVSVICRSGVPITVHTMVLSRLDRLSDEQLVIRRDISARLDGKGGSPFRGLELSGTTSGVQRVEISALRGTVERLEGSSTLTLQVTERTPGNAPRSQQVTQRVELKAERAP